MLSGPPGPVIFTWRHWAHFTGTFQGRTGSGELIEMYGLGRVIVNENLKIQKLEVSKTFLIQIVYISVRSINKKQTYRLFLYNIK